MNYHFVQQENWNDCGLACLAMLIENYQQKRFSIYQLKKDLTPTAELGLSFFDLIQLGEKYKLKGEGFNCDFALLKDNAHRCPFILNVKNEQGASHYVVLNKVDNDYFYLNDPSQNSHLIKLKPQELESIFLAKVLIFQKSGLLKGERNWNFCFQWLKKDYWHLFSLVFSALLANFFWLLSSSFIQTFSQWINQCRINWWELVTFITYVFLASIFDFYQNHSSWIWSQKTWTKLLQQFLNSEEKGLQERMWRRKLDELSASLELLQLYQNLIIQSLLALIFVPILELWIGKINILFCFLPFIFLIIILFGKIIIKQKKNNLKIKHNFHDQNYQESLNHYLIYYPLIRNRGLKNNFLQKIEQQSHRCQTINQQNNCYQIGIIVWEKFWTKMFYFILLVLVYFIFQINNLVITDLLYLIILANYLLTLLNQTIGIWLDFFLLEKSSYQKKESKLNLINFNLTLENVETFVCKELILKNQINELLMINQNLNNSFFVSGNEEFVISFFEIISNFQTIGGQIKINNQNFIVFQNQFFILTNNMDLIPGTLIENLFNWNVDIDSQIYQLVNPFWWLEKYQIDFSNQNFVNKLNFQQKQLINFLASFFSSAKIFVFQNCLNTLEENDQEELLNLFFQLKPQCFVILAADNLILERFFCQKLVIAPMI